MNQPDNYHMSAADFRRHGHALIDWIADYWENAERYPVLSQVAPGDVRAQLPAQPPQQGEPFEAMLRDVEQIIMPGVTHWQSPNFFAFFPSNTSGPSFLGEMLSSGLSVQGMLWATSPACTELETHVLDWLVEMLGLPDKFKSTTAGGGVIQDSASSATLVAMLAARERATGYAAREEGLTQRLVAYSSTQAHSSIPKAAMIAGIGRKNLRLIPVDENYAMRPEALAAQIEADKAAGLIPFFVNANVGSTSSGAFDPLQAIGRLCREHNLWFHVDAAMYGTAAIVPAYRWIQAGVDLADSYTFNPHKWLFTNFDCNCFYVADRASLIGALTVLPEYLRNQATDSGTVIDYRDWQIPLGRRFRALKLWFVIRHYGVEGLRYHIERHVTLAQQFAKWVDAHADFELVAPAPLSLVCFRHVGGDAVNERLLTTLNASGDLYLTHTKLDGRYVLRFVVGQARTEATHVVQAWQRIQAAAQQAVDDEA
jgi:aromatic-L-amino-acid decarboxylase